MDNYKGFSWRRTNAPTASSRTDDIWFFDENRGIAVNSNGQILATSNGGDSWQVRAHYPGIYLRCVGFANANVGWVGTVEGDQRLFKTIDGGMTWSPVTNLPSGPPQRICGLTVVDENTGYFSGTNYPDERTGILKTSDGGNTWQVIDMAPHAALLVDILFINSDEGWVVGGRDTVKHPDRSTIRNDVVPTVLHTRDGGRTWANVLADEFGGPLRAPLGEWGWKIQRLTPDTMFVATENFHDGAILRTDDGGRTWRRLRINDRQRNSNLEGVGFLDENKGWVGGWGDIDFFSGSTSATTDGGDNWDDANDVGFRLNRFRFIGNPVRVAYASGDTVYKFSDEPAPPAALSASPRPMAVTEATDTPAGASVRWEWDQGSETLELRVFERFGRLIRREVIARSQAATSQTVTWDHRDGRGRTVSDGGFVMRLTAGEKSQSWLVNKRSPRHSAKSNTASPQIAPTPSTNRQRTAQMTNSALAKVYSVDEVEAILTRTKPPFLMLHAVGRVTTSGWSNGQLSPYVYVTPQKDGIQDFDFLAEPPSPGDITIPVLTPISAQHQERDIDAENYWGIGQPLVGVRVHASENSKVVYLKPPAQMLAESVHGMPMFDTARTAMPTTMSGVPSFEADIKPLFRPRDVNVMRAVRGFDLHNYDDVKQHADAIAASLRRNMPCDGLWPETDIVKFETWKDGGMPR